MVIQIIVNIGKSPKLKMSQKVEKVLKGSAPKIKKSKIHNLDFLIRGGGVRTIRFFPNVNVDFERFS